MSPSREIVQQAYIRVCRDSGFQIHWIAACHIVSQILEIPALDVWLKFGDMSNMVRIAEGTHPCLELERYGGPKSTLKQE